MRTRTDDDHPTARGLRLSFIDQTAGGSIVGFKFHILYDVMRPNIVPNFDFEIMLQQSRV